MIKGLPHTWHTWQKEKQWKTKKNLRSKRNSAQRAFSKLLSRSPRRWIESLHSQLELPAEDPFSHLELPQPYDHVIWLGAFKALALLILLVLFSSITSSWDWSLCILPSITISVSECRKPGTQSISPDKREIFSRQHGVWGLLQGLS